MCEVYPKDIAKLAFENYTWLQLTSEKNSAEVSCRGRLISCIGKACAEIHQL